jgi:hypothetical protein
MPEATLMRSQRRTASGGSSLPECEWPVSDRRYKRLADIASVIAGQSPPSETYNDQGRGLRHASIAVGQFLSQLGIPFTRGHSSGGLRDHIQAFLPESSGRWTFGLTFQRSLDRFPASCNIIGWVTHGFSARAYQAPFGKSAESPFDSASMPDARL